MNLSEIHYPVFRLGNERPITSGGVDFYLYDRVDDEGNIYTVMRIVDDKNIEADSLALRRLIVKSKELDSKVRLYRITKAIFFLGDLIKLANGTRWFIDSKGKIFKYEKSTRAKLSYHKIVKLIPIKTGGAIVEAQGIPSRFKSLYYPESNMLYCGILHVGMTKILYGFYDQKYKDTWRMI